jgi:inhibitor of cysteine peptidase
MKTRLVVLLGMMTVLPVLGACPGLPDSGFTYFTDIRQDNYTGTCQVGDRVTALLRANPSTGYQWEVSAADASVLELVQSYFAPDDPSVVGGAGTLAMEFEVVGVGTSQLVLQYVRPSDPPGTPPDKTFTLTVDATP